MFSRNKLFITLICVLLIISAVNAALPWVYYSFTDTGTHVWNSAANWSPGLPDPCSQWTVAQVEPDSNNTGKYCLIDSSQTVRVQVCRVGVNSNGRLNMTGGTLNIGDANGVAGSLKVGQNAGSNYSVFDMSGGTVNNIGNVELPPTGYYPKVYMYLRGGVFKATTFTITAHSSWLTNPAYADNRGHLEISNNGVLILDGDKQATLQGYINNGWITQPYGARGVWLLDYNVRNTGKTTLSVYYNPAAAWSPSPADGSTIIVQSPLLGWKKGDNTVSNELYLGSTFADVNNADRFNVSGIYKGVRDPNTYTPSGLQLGQTYYWRVDEVTNVGQRTKGRIWSFNIAAYEIVDDMEIYTTGNIASTWVNSGGASVTVSDFNHADGQSLKLYYNTTAGSVTKTLTAANNWADNSVSSLTLFLSGDLGNSVTGLSLYVKLEDSLSHSLKQYLDIDQDQLKRDFWEKWIECDIDLSKFAIAGVDITSIKKITIGYEGLTSGSGILYVDDIRLYASRCISHIAKQRGDFTGDCKADVQDLVQLGQYWRYGGTEVMASVPNDTNLVLWYKFDDAGYMASDSSENEYDGYTTDFMGHLSSDGHNGGCFNFNGYFGVTVPPEAFTTVKDEVTFSVWIKGDSSKQPENNGAIFNGGVWPSHRVFLARCPYYNTTDGSLSVLFRAGDQSGYDDLSWKDSRNKDWADQWNHYAFVKDRTHKTADGNEGRMWIYENGILVATSGGKVKPMDSIPSEGFVIGSLTSSALPYIGELDDFRIYNRALTQSEIVSLAGQSQVFQPLIVGVGADANGDNVIDFKDLAALAGSWLQNVNWP